MKARFAVYVSILLVFLMNLVLPTAMASSGLITAKGFPGDELQNLDRNPNWVANKCDTGGSVSPDAGTTASAGNPGSLYILGDSILVGAYFTTKDLQKDIAAKNWTAEVDASGARGMLYKGSDPRGTLPGRNLSGLAAIKADAETIKTSDTVVIELGTNESGSPKAFKSQMEQAITEVRAIKSNVTIYWVNIFSAVTHPFTPDVKAYNVIINDVAAATKINVLDTTKANIPLSPDHIHPDYGSGWTIFSKTIVDGLAQVATNGPLASSSDSTATGGCCSGGGTSTVGATSSNGDLVWPFGTKSASQYNRVDQGWDIQDKAGASIYAIAPGTLHKLNKDTGNFGNDYPTEELDKSIGGPTTWVYYGHVHIDPALEGKHVDAGQKIATANKVEGENGSGAPPGWLEIGFSRPGTDAPVAHGMAASPEDQKMKDLLIGTKPGAGTVTPSADAPSDAAATCCTGATTSFGPGTLPSYIKEPYNSILTAAGKKFNVDPAYLVGIFYDENFGYANAVSAFDKHTQREPPPPYGHGAPWPGSSAGAEGPFQFIYSTYYGSKTYQIDANGDGKADRNDLTDESFSAAKLLANSGGAGTLTLAKVIKSANAYSGGYPQYPQAAWAIVQKIHADGGGGTGAGAAGGSGTAEGSDCSGGSTASAGNYQNPFRDVHNIAQAGIDAGVDYSGDGPVHPIGDGTLVYVNGSSGWVGGNAIAYKVKGGAADGKTIYVAENCTVNKSLKVPDPVHADTVLCTMHNAYPYIETGWATAGTDTPVAYTDKCYYITNPSLSKTSTRYGINFDKLMRKLGAPKASLLAPPITCNLPSNWPSW